MYYALKLTLYHILFAVESLGKFILLQYRHVLTQLLCHKQDVTQGQFFLSGVQVVWIQSYPSSRLFDRARLKNPVFMSRGRTDGFMPFPKALVPNKTNSFILDLNLGHRFHFPSQLFGQAQGNKCRGQYTAAMVN